MIRFAIGTLISLAAFFFSFYLEGGAIADFALPSPLIFVVLVPLFAVFAVWSLGEFGRAWKAAFSRTVGEGERREAVSLWDFYEKVCYTAGLVGTLAGFMIIFKDKDHAMVVFSIVVIPLIEGIILGLVARILKARVEKNGRA